jgi:hypothetical protein
MSELFTYGSVGGVGGNPDSYPEEKEVSVVCIGKQNDTYSLS